MNRLARISAGIAVPAVSLAVAACGGSQHTATSNSAASEAPVVAHAAGSANTAVVSGATEATASESGAAASRSVVRSHKLDTLTTSQQKGLYSEGAHPKVAGIPASAAPTRSTTHDRSSAAGAAAPTRSTTHDRSSAAGARPATLKPAPKQPNLGKYVGPPNNGAGSCGYVAVGPGMEQAAAFAVRSVDCDTARRVAVASKGHTTVGRASYRALGFSCTGSTPSNQSTLRYVCNAGGQSISFIIS